MDEKTMDSLSNDIPLFETILVMSLLGLSGLGFYSLERRKKFTDSIKLGFARKMILASLVVLSLMATIFLIIVSFLPA
jgi:hypothetical protein